jgi:hypothetical protein
MDLQWEWERIGNFGSLRERDCFVAWMRGQIANGMAEEIESPADEPGEQWFRHIPTGSLWRLVSDENPYGARLLACIRQGRIGQRPPQLAASFSI